MRRIAKMYTVSGVGWRVMLVPNVEREWRQQQQQQLVSHFIKYIQIQLNNRHFLVSISDDGRMYAFCVCRAYGVGMHLNGITSTGFIFLSFFSLFLMAISLTANGKVHKTTAKYLLCAVFCLFFLLFCEKYIYSSVQLLPTPTVPETQQQKLPPDGEKTSEEEEWRRRKKK